MIRLFSLGLFLTCLVPSIAGADLTKATAAQIDRLLDTVEKSKCVFIRNGSEHTGKDAAAHMRAKYKYFKKEIRTVDDFIAKCATKSELSGKPYLVKLENGQTVRCDKWMKTLVLAKDPAPSSDHPK